MKQAIIRLMILLLLMTGYTNCGPMGDGKGYVEDASPFSSMLSGDPLNKYAWHLQNWGQKVYSVLGGTKNVDIDMLETLAQGYDGSGIKVCVVDQGIDSSHIDLATNMLPGASVDYSTTVWGTSADPIHADDNHGTSVAGLIAAVASNNIGSRGVASGATLASKNLLSESLGSNIGDEILIDSASGDFDIFNYSFGTARPVTFWELEDFLRLQLIDSVTNGRSGKGAVFVKAAGNDFEYDIPLTTLVRHMNANIDGLNSNPYVIVVGAVNASGVKSEYSVTGSSLWVSAPSGGAHYPYMVTTDRTGCTQGYASTGYALYYPSFNYISSVLNPNCSFDIAFNGTSAATPVTSGVIALMLQANPNLSWRDVKDILARTARKIDSKTISRSNQFVTSPVGHTWEQGWVKNSAGFHFNNFYGFGLISADAAVAMAKNYTSNLGTFTQTSGESWDWTVVSLAVPDNSATGVTNLLNVSANFVIEAVELRLEIDHVDVGQLGVELTSPGGTKSILMNVNNSLYGPLGYNDENILLSNAFYGESSTGNWTIKVIDGGTGTTGTLTGWGLKFYGHSP